MKNITVNRIESTEILDKCAELLVDAYNGEPWNDSWTKEIALEKLTCFYNSPKFLGWVAMEGDDLLGCCVGNVEPYFTGDYFYLKEMFVPVANQHKGVGSRLMAAINEHLKSTGIQMVILFTSNAGFPFKFWQKQGFAEMEDMRMMYLENGELRMENGEWRMENLLG